MPDAFRTYERQGPVIVGVNNRPPGDDVDDRFL